MKGQVTLLEKHAQYLMRGGRNLLLTSKIQLKSTCTVPEHMDVKLFLFLQIVTSLYSCSIHSFTLYSFYENAGMLVGLYIISFVIALLGQ